MRSDSTACSGLQHSLPNLLRRTHLAFLKVLEAKLIDHHIPLVAWKFLRALWDEDDISVQQLSQHLDVSSSEVISSLESLAELGLVIHPRGGTELPGTVLMTPAGKALQAELGSVPADIMKLSQTRLSAEEQAEMWRLLSTVLDTLQSALGTSESQTQQTS